VSEIPPKFNPNLPLVHSISSFRLKDIGFIRFGVELGKGQSIITVYKRGEDEIRYDGVNWIFNGNHVQFIQEIQ